jgi:hypothetical protein
MNDQQRAAMQMALEALLDGNALFDLEGSSESYKLAITALREALAQEDAPQTCEKHCERNAYQIEIRRLKRCLFEMQNAAIALAQPQDSQSNYDIALSAGFSDWEIGIDGNCSATQLRRMKRINRLINLSRSSIERPQGEPVAFEQCEELSADKARWYRMADMIEQQAQELKDVLRQALNLIEGEWPEGDEVAQPIVDKIKKLVGERSDG